MNWFIFGLGALFFATGISAVYGLQLPFLPLKLDRFGMGWFAGVGMSFILLSSLIKRGAA